MRYFLSGKLGDSPGFGTDFAALYYNIFSVDLNAKLATLDPNVRGQLNLILKAAMSGPVTTFSSQDDSFYLGLAQQFLTLAPTWLINDVSNIQSIAGRGWDSSGEEGSNPYANRVWYPIGLFSRAVSNQAQSFIPVTLLPGPITPFLTQQGAVLPIAPSSGQNQELVLPVRPEFQPVASQPPISQNPIATPPPDQTPVIVSGGSGTTSVETGTSTATTTPTIDNSWIWLIVIGAALLLSTRTPGK